MASDQQKQDQQTPEQAPEKSVFLRTYGCQMNVYDSERMLALLKPLGYGVAEKPENADLVIINTCHIREKAADKVYSDLGRLKKLKRKKEETGGKMSIVVAGCVAQAEGAEITRRVPQVDMVIGPQAYHRLPELIARAAREKGEILETDFAVEEKFDRLAKLTASETETRPPAAFVTIQEGCDKFCTFCVVPYTRGEEVSRSVESIVAEVRLLASQGVREVTLLGQNVNAWRARPPAGHQGGTDGWGLGELCRHLALIDGIERIRFMTSHPRDMDDGLIAALGEEEKLMPFLHLPVQAGSDRILKAMNRGHTAEHYLKLVARIREARPGIALSGDFIIGFPGETNEDFEATLALVREVGYASAYSFKYSRRPGTPGAMMQKQVAEDEKDGRLAQLQVLLEEQRAEFNQTQLGKTVAILLEKKGRYEGQLVGRTPYLQSVHVTAAESMIGSIASAYIEDVTPMALAGRLVGEAEQKPIAPAIDVPIADQRG